MLSELSDILKQTAIRAVEAQKPVEAFFGRVTAVNPIEVRVSQKQYLHRENLIMPEYVQSELPVTGSVTVDFGEYSRECPFTGTAVVDNALRENDKVVLLRVHKGQKYIVVGRSDADDTDGI